MKENRGPVMGIDYGSVRVGIALSDLTGRLATGLVSLPNDARLFDQIKAIIEERSVSAIVLGMPYRSDMKQGSKEQEVKAFSKKLQAHCGLRPIFRDERFTTVIAHQKLSTSKRKGKAKRAVIDQVAAEVILQDYLDEQR